MENLVIRESVKVASAEVKCAPGGTFMAPFSLHIANKLASLKLD